MLLLLQADASLGQKKETPSGLDLPRFVSLRSDKVFVRVGPGPDYKIAFTFQHAGLPVEIYQETETWRRVRDSEGTTGWVFHALLSSRRTALVLPWEAKDAKTSGAEVRARKSDTAAVVAVVEAGVLANIRTCDGTWCEVTIGNVSGFLEQKKLWGVYPAEIVK